MWIILLIALSGGLAWFATRYLRELRRGRLFRSPFPQAWTSILERNVPLYEKLPADLKQELLGLIQVFISEKLFVGCAGLEIDDEIRVTISAFACILLLNKNHNYYPGFTSIYVYPSGYIAESKNWDGLVQSVSREVRLGESWHRGPIVLSWDSVLRGALDIKDGHNVTFHEFAHKLDEQAGSVDGVPLLGQRSHYISWARTMRKEFEALKRKSRRREKSVLGYYGATEPEEFFAVLTETFFEKPKQLKAKHPELYEEVKEYYQLNPLEWMNAH